MAGYLHPMTKNQLPATAAIPLILIFTDYTAKQKNAQKRLA
jgi:hypothetical protein